jgi:Uma2 family endonuclease
MRGHHVFSYEDYLQYENDIRREAEWLAGDILPIANSPPEHARMSAEVMCRLRLGAQHRIYARRLKVRVVETDLVAYPDVTVVAGPIQADTRDPEAIVNPTILIEVVAPATAECDRVMKWSHYRRIPSLAAYMLVDHCEPRIETYERIGDDFAYRSFTSGETVCLPGLGPLEVDARYARRITA